MRRREPIIPDTDRPAPVLKWALMVLLAAGLGAGTSLATGRTDKALAFQGWVAGLFQSGSQDVGEAKLDDYVISLSVFDPKSFADAFVLNGKPDPTVMTCFSGQYEDEVALTVDVFEYHGHRATAAVAHCLLTQNPERFCQPEGRRLVAAAAEFYFWSRDYIFAAPDDRERRFHMHHLEDDNFNPDGADHHFKTWDGPEDRQFLGDLKALARAGYIDAATFSMSRRPEVRDAISQVKKEHSACAQGSTPT